MRKPLFLKTDNTDGVPSIWELNDFESKHGVSVNEVQRLYVKFKVGKRKKVKRLRIRRTTYACETCGFHSTISGEVGGKEFDRDLL